MALLSRTLHWPVKGGETCEYSGCRNEAVRWIQWDGRKTPICRHHLADRFWPNDLKDRVADARKALGGADG